MPHRAFCRHGGKDHLALVRRAGWGDPSEFDLGLRVLCVLNGAVQSAQSRSVDDDSIFSPAGPRSRTRRRLNRAGVTAGRMSIAVLAAVPVFLLAIIIILVLVHRYDWLPPLGGSIKVKKGSDFISTFREKILFVHSWCYLF